MLSLFTLPIELWRVGLILHSDGSSGQRYIVETVASGLATFDFDQDGWIDILFLSGAFTPG